MNEIGQRTGLTTSGTAFPNLPSWFWGYDSLGQVTSADSSITSNDRSYEYDTIGNRKKSSDSLTLATSDNYTANALNQYSAIQEGGTGVSPVYDDDGNTTAYSLPVAPGTNNTLVWDAENRMISSTVGSITTTYAYDALSRRSRQEQTPCQSVEYPVYFPQARRIGVRRCFGLRPDHPFHPLSENSFGRRRNAGEISRTATT